MQSTRLVHAGATTSFLHSKHQFNLPRDIDQNLKIDFLNTGREMILQSFSLSRTGKLNTCCLLSTFPPNSWPELRSRDILLYLNIQSEEHVELDICIDPITPYTTSMLGISFFSMTIPPRPFRQTLPRQVNFVSATAWPTSQRWFHFNAFERHHHQQLPSSS